VWCAAGKELFSTREVVRMVQKTGLERVVGHRRLILPQFGATGVNAREVRKNTSFSVVWGPIRAEDIPGFLEKGRADTDMRRVTFTLRERAELIPVEFANFGKKGLLLLLFFFLLSGIGPEVFSLSSMYSRGLTAAGAILSGAVAGLVLLPLLLPWLPGRAFAHKAVYPGLGLGLLFLFLARGGSLPWGRDVRNVFERGYKFVSGNAFYRVHSVYFSFRGGKGDEAGFAFAWRRGGAGRVLMAHHGLYLRGFLCRISDI
jgi:hypothetical protein